MYTGVMVTYYIIRSGAAVLGVVTSLEDVVSVAGDREVEISLVGSGEES